MGRVTAPQFGGKRLAVTSAVIGGCGLVVFVISLLVSPKAALYGWLAAFSFAASIAIGALLFLMVGNAASATWPVVVRRFTEGVAGTLPVAALAFVVVAAGAKTIYVWVSPPPDLDPSLLHAIQHKHAYLNLPAFTIRGAVFFAIWGFTWLAILRRPDKARAMSSALLPVVVVTATFAAFDWLMSLDPEWFSSAFGLYYLSGGFVAAVSLVALLAEAARQSGAVDRRAVAPQHFHALGRLIFGLSIFWAYLAFFQALIIQLASKPEEVSFYRERIEDGRWVLFAVVVLLRFFVPFFLLMPRALKLRPRLVAATGAGIVLAHYLDVVWIEGRVIPVWIALSALAAVSGGCVAFATVFLRGKPLLPIGDPALEAAIAYRSQQ